MTALNFGRETVREDICLKDLADEESLAGWNIRDAATGQAVGTVDDSETLSFELEELSGRVLILQK